MVIPRNSATCPRASPVGTWKKRVPASEIAQLVGSVPVSWTVPGLSDDPRTRTLDSLSSRGAAPEAAQKHPRKPITRVALATAEDQALLGHLLLTAAKIAREQGFSDDGFRLVINNGRDGGEAVPHLHVHILAGRQMEWPPG